MGLFRFPTCCTFLVITMFSKDIMSIHYVRHLSPMRSLGFFVNPIHLVHFPIGETSRPFWRGLKQLVLSGAQLIAWGRCRWSCHLAPRFLLGVLDDDLHREEFRWGGMKWEYWKMLGKLAIFCWKKKAGVEKNPKIQVHIAASCDAPDDFLWGDFVANQVPRCVASSQTGWRGDLQAVPFFFYLAKSFERKCV